MFFAHRFVDFIPKELEPGVLYIALDFGSVVHLCACGCGGEAVTPLSPTDWSITYDGETISLSPSVGNWSFLCQSHYFITRGQVRWAAKWSTEQIQAGREFDFKLKGGMDSESNSPASQQEFESRAKRSWFSGIIRKLFG